MVVASLAALSARSLPGMEEWTGIHRIKIEDEMELMELWMENVRRCDEMTVSHKDLLSVQKSTAFEWWLALVSVQDNADSTACFFLIGAGKSLSFCFDDGDYIRLERGSSSEDCSCTPISCSSTSRSIGVDNVISLVGGNGGKATLPFYAIVISSTGNTWDRGRDSSNMRGALLPWWKWKMRDVLSVLKIRWQDSWEFFCFSMKTWATLKALWNVDI